MDQKVSGDIVERLMKSSLDDDVYHTWGEIRKMLLEGVLGTMPRELFEMIIENIDEERTEAASRITELQRRLSIAETKLGFVKLHWINPEGQTIEEMRNNLRGSDLYQRGDAVLVWVNQGDLLAVTAISENNVVM